jgi:hypothetical protein
MNINWFELHEKEHIFASLLNHAFSGKGFDNLENFDSTKLDVVLSINGVEVNILESMDFLQRKIQASHDKELLELREIRDYINSHREIINSMELD